MENYFVGQNFKYKKFKFKIVNITQKGIEILNMDKGTRETITFYDFLRLKKKKEIV